MAVDAEGGAPAEGELDASMEPQPDCPICLEPIDQLQKLPCGHNVCGPCLQRLGKVFHEQHQQNAGTSEHSYDLDNPPPAGLDCPSCRARLSRCAEVPGGYAAAITADTGLGLRRSRGQSADTATQEAPQPTTAAAAEDGEPSAAGGATAGSSAGGAKKRRRSYASDCTWFTNSSIPQVICR